MNAGISSSSGSTEAFSDALEDRPLMGEPREQGPELGGAPLGFRHASRSP